jgi:hypothetical protein
MRTHNGCRNGRAFFGETRALHCSSFTNRRPRHPYATCHRLPTVVVEANNLNRWGDTSGPEEDGETADLAFERDVAHSVCKVS